LSQMWVAAVATWDFFMPPSAMTVVWWSKHCDWQKVMLRF